MGDTAHYSDSKPPAGNSNIWRQVGFGDGWGDNGCEWREGMEVTVFNDGHVEVYVPWIKDDRSGRVSFEVEIIMLDPLGRRLEPRPGSWEEMFPLFQGMTSVGHKETITVPFPPRDYITRNLPHAGSFACYRHSNSV
ncbi:hypothetical protein [Paraburkholderia sp. BCC1886]|uniref:hypothetical protein n=1 Tax=Paraburkholderia sp. BCC1886 TaxID=2562670 RepID=UPI001181E270|nr:hypothetical protein [Paraburkholderia sp. BCC1886]